jgi:hypothetical protein
MLWSFLYITTLTAIELFTVSPGVHINFLADREKLAVHPSTRSGRTGLGVENSADFPFRLSLSKQEHRRGRAVPEFQYVP